jgi:hypothetical protein
MSAAVIESRPLGRVRSAWRVRVRHRGVASRCSRRSWRSCSRRRFRSRTI